MEESREGVKAGGCGCVRVKEGSPRVPRVLEGERNWKVLAVMRCDAMLFRELREGAMRGRRWQMAASCSASGDDAREIIWLLLIAISLPRAVRGSEGDGSCSIC